jgi:hypothetical protein
VSTEDGSLQWVARAGYVEPTHETLVPHLARGVLDGGACSDAFAPSGAFGQPALGRGMLWGLVAFEVAVSPHGCALIKPLEWRARYPLARVWP